MPFKSCSNIQNATRKADCFTLVCFMWSERKSDIWGMLGILGLVCPQCSKLIKIVTCQHDRLPLKVFHGPPSYVRIGIYFLKFILTMCKMWILTLFYKNGCISFNNGLI